MGQGFPAGKLFLFYAPRGERELSRSLLSLWHGADAAPLLLAMGHWAVGTHFVTWSEGLTSHWIQGMLSTTVTLHQYWAKLLTSSGIDELCNSALAYSAWGYFSIIMCLLKEIRNTNDRNKVLYMLPFKAKSALGVLSFSLLSGLHAVGGPPQESKAGTPHAVRLPPLDILIQAEGVQHVHNFSLLSAAVDEKTYPELAQEMKSCTPEKVLLLTLGSDISISFDPPLHQPIHSDASSRGRIIHAKGDLLEDHWGHLEVHCQGRTTPIELYFESVEGHGQKHSLFVRPWSKELGGGRLQAVGKGRS